MYVYMSYNSWYESGYIKFIFIYRKCAIYTCAICQHGLWKMSIYNYLRKLGEYIWVKVRNVRQIIEKEPEIIWKAKVYKEWILCEKD